MIYTCYEMIRDCRADREEGWAHFIVNYIPLIRRLLTHYQPGAGDSEVILRRVVEAVRRPESSIFQSLEPAPERWFVAQLRQKVVAELAHPPVVIPLSLETLGSALESFTLTEKQAAWLEGMRYSPADAGVLLRMAPSTVEKIRAKAADLIRGKVDSWNRTLLADNGLLLGGEAEAAAGTECLPPKTFLDMVDGRTSWQGRGELERHVIGCWHCIDHFCRLVEVVELLRDAQPLSASEAEPFRKLLKIPQQSRPVWKRWLAGKA